MYASSEMAVWFGVILLGGREEEGERNVTLVYQAPCVLTVITADRLRYSWQLRTLGLHAWVSSTQARCNLESPFKARPLVEATQCNELQEMGLLSSVGR